MQNANGGKIPPFKKKPIRLLLELICVVNETEDKIAILHCLQMFPVYNLLKLEGGGDLGLILEVLNVLSALWLYNCC